MRHAEAERRPVSAPRGDVRGEACPREAPPGFWLAFRGDDADSQSYKQSTGPETRSLALPHLPSQAPPGYQPLWMGTHRQASGGKEVGFTASRKAGVTVRCKARPFPAHDSSPDRLCRPSSGKRLCEFSSVLSRAFSCCRPCHLGSCSRNSMRKKTCPTASS